MNMCNELKLNSEELLDILIKDAEYPFSGWDFSFIKDRLVEDPLTWSYPSIVIPLIRKAKSLLDMGTGGGELLFSLAPLPDKTCATEAYFPNVPIAKERLEPLGVKVVQIEEEAKLPFKDNEFDLVINRHEWYSPEDVYRIIKSEGLFITQQVGDKSDTKLRFLLSGKETTEDHFEWNLNYAVKELEDAGFRILEEHESVGSTRIFDVGAIVYYFKAVPWELPDFTVEKYREKLLEIQEEISKNGFLELKENNHRFLIKAVKD